MVQKSSQKLKILVLMKRFGAGKDMVMQDFGRQVRLLEGVAALGHNVDFFVADYKKREKKNVKLHGMNFCIRPYSLPGHFVFMHALESTIENGKYDCIIGTSDPLLGILGYHLSRKFRIKHVYDMQDEYSCYASYKIPLVKWLDRKSVIGSDIVVTVSDSLKSYIKTFRKKPVYTIQNGVNSNLFKADRKKSRKTLDLPDGKIIIYVGEISRFKGVDVLIKSFKEVRRLMPNTHLLLSGPVVDVDIKNEGIIYKKLPLRREVAEALSASDVAVLPNVRNSFSEYCFPYKLPEYMAAGIPIVASDVGDASLILSDFKNSLCKAGDSQDMAAKIVKVLSGNAKPNYSRVLKSLEWRALSRKLLSIMEK